MSLKGNTIEQEQDLANLEQVKKCYELGQKAYQEKDYRLEVLKIIYFEHFQQCRP